MLAKDIHKKYYSGISEVDFKRIVAADTVSSNLAKGKLGKYAKWMLNLYKTKNLKLEDLRKAIGYITTFNKVSLRNKLKNKDLNNYHSLTEMYLAIQEFFQQPISKAEKIRRVKSRGAEKLYEDERFVV
ncbi:MAG: hypothetical protein LBL13_05600, partial [Bacteroidales bacterium]|nr:hypothetical protein [Bacteroidales bacterium]